MCPEFLREGQGVADFYDPELIVIGCEQPSAARTIAKLFSALPVEPVVTEIRTAEALKYACNAYHAVKVSFTNEFGRLCQVMGVYTRDVMRIFCQDKRLNISTAYLRPGFAFGGSCLPKDVRALLHKAKTLDVTLPILASILPSNQLQIERGIQAVVEKGRRKVGILGFSFKAGTDDLRESPMVELCERLIGKGYDLRVYDRNVSLAALHGANRDYILNRIPHISRLMVPTIDEVLGHAETVVIGNASPEFAGVPARIGEGQTVIDFVRVCDSRTVLGVYEGLCW
jgi:GDP-mannose 6-dehydrogenase